MPASGNATELTEPPLSIAPRLIPVGQELSDYYRDKFGAEISLKTLKGRFTREPALQAVYLFGKPYTTPAWADEWLFSRLRDAPPRGSAKPRPCSIAQLRALFACEEDEIRADMQRADLSERERTGDVWADAPA